MQQFAIKLDDKNLPQITCITRAPLIDEPPTDDESSPLYFVPSWNDAQTVFLGWLVLTEEYLSARYAFNYHDAQSGYTPIVKKKQLV